MQRIIERSAIAMALAGGLTLLALIAMICVSVAGRALGGIDQPWLDWAGAIRGDFELVEAGMGFAVFAFLPLCQLRGGHAVVDLVTSQMPARVTRVLAAFWEGVFALVLALICWRLGVALMEKACVPHRWTGAWCSIETSFLIGFPIWWSYAAAWLASALAAVTALWCCWYRIARGDLPERPRYEEPL